MNDLALSKKIEELIKENSSLTQENRMLKHQKDRLGINYITTPEKGDAQSLLNGEIPFLKKIPELSLIKDDKGSDALFEVAANTDHLLIESDNLSALVTLQHTHAGKIDVIYIDPPYNTGNKDFVYNDSFVSNDDGFRHSKWLSFMRPRLELAKKLLSETGVIFVSIDDNEQAHLKLLMDKIFGEQNFVANIIYDGGLKNNSRFVSVGHDYMLVYSRNKDTLIQKNIEWREEKRGIDLFKNFIQVLKNHSGTKEEKQKFLRSWLVEAKKDNVLDKGLFAYNMIDDEDNIFASDNTSAPGGNGARYEVLHPITGQPVKQPSGGWRYSEKTMREKIHNNEILFGDDENTTPRLKRILSDDGANDKQVARSYFWAERSNANKELQKILGRNTFNFPKDVQVIKRWISLTSNPNAIILDFFAGSGTTGHAVAELNNEDGGTRQAILITNSGEASRLSREDFKKSVNALTDSQLSILKEKIIVDEQVNSNSLPVRTSPDKWGKTQEPFEIKKSGLFATLVESANEHYVRWQKICDYLEIENVFDPVNLASDVTAERMKRVLTGKNWFDGKKRNSLPGNLHYYKLELDNLTKDVYSIPDKINLQKYVGVVSLEENAHNVLEQLPDTYKDSNNSIENNDAIVLSSDDKLILVYGNYDKVLFSDDDFINTVNDVRNFAEITNKLFKLYVVSVENETFTINNFRATPYPILYTTKVDKTVSTLEKQGFLVKDVESN